MMKNIGVLAAVAFVLGSQGVTAASISETRLQELMSSTSAQAVSLETLRARDREILEELARSLAERYSDVLAGSEMVFTRLSESGSIFYRLDFVGLKNRDRARAMCEVLEMERCIAKIGNDRLTVLEVRTDPNVSAIAIVEQDDVAPFDYYADEPVPEHNPKGRQIEAHVRNMLDPLNAYPEPRPDLAAYLADPAQGQEQVQRSVREADPIKEVQPEPIPETVIEPVVDTIDDLFEESFERDLPPAVVIENPEEEFSLYPLARPNFSVAMLTPSHPVPMARPGMRIASAEVPAALYPLARPFGVEPMVVASAVASEVVPQVAPEVAPEVTPEVTVAVVKAVEGDTRDTASAMLGVNSDGFFEVADAIQPRAPAPKKLSSVMRLSSLGTMDMSAIRASTRQLESARAVLPGVETSPLNTARQSLRSSVAPVAVILKAPRVAPTPVARMAALEDLDLRRADRAAQIAQTSGEMAPKPMIRELALISVAPAPVVMTSVAALSAPSITDQPSFEAPQLEERGVQIAAVTALTEPAQDMDVAMATPENPEAPVVRVAQSDPVSVPLRMVVADIIQSAEVVRPAEIKIPDQVEVAHATPTLEVQPPVNRIPDFEAPSADIAQLGRVSFDDRYARPSDVDFNDGQVAGRLQKLPFRRPDLSAYRAAKATPAQTILEAGTERAAAMISATDAPFEIAQVPGLGAPKLDDTEPFVLQEPSQSDAKPASMLDQLLSNEASSSVDVLSDAAAPIAPADAPLQGKPSSMLFEGTQPDVVADPQITPQAEPQTQVVTAPAVAQPTVAPARPSLPKFTEDAPKPAASMPTLQLTSDMKVEAPKAAPTFPAVSARAPIALPAEDIVRAPAASELRAEAPQKGLDLSGTFEAPVGDQQLYQARQIEDGAAQQRRALDVLGEIVKSRQEAAAQTAAPQEAPRQLAALAPRTPSASVQGSSQRRAYPRAEDAGNRDLAAAQEVSGFEASFSDDRSKMARAADPLGRVSPSERMQRHNSLEQATAPEDLRIELSYVGSRDQVMARVAELKGFFPPVMTSKGRFFGASVPEQPDRFVVGIAAHDLQARNDIVWYLEQMQIPWAMR